MRFLIGILFGVALTVGGAYLHDNVTVGRDAVAANRPALVNWDVAFGLWSDTRNRVVGEVRDIAR